MSLTCWPRGQQHTRQQEIRWGIYDHQIWICSVNKVQAWFEAWNIKLTRGPFVLVCEDGHFGERNKRCCTQNSPDDSGWQNLLAPHVQSSCTKRAVATAITVQTDDCSAQEQLWGTGGWARFGVLQANTRAWQSLSLFGLRYRCGDIHFHFSKVLIPFTTFYMNKW